MAAALQAAGFVCYVPQNNGIEVAAVVQLLNDPSLQQGTMLEPPVLDRCMAWVTRAVVALDVYQTIEACQCTVLNLDGRVPDEGSLVESTLAWCVGHPVVPYKTSAITELDGHDNPMIGALSGWASVPSDPASVVVAVQDAVSTSRSPAPPPPPDVQKLVDLGRVISGIRAQPPLNDIARKAAKTTLKSLPPDQMSLLEPDRHCKRCAGESCWPSSNSANSVQATRPRKKQFFNARSLRSGTGWRSRAFAGCSFAALSASERELPGLPYRCSTDELVRRELLHD